MDIGVGDPMGFCVVPSILPITPPRQGQGQVGLTGKQATAVEQTDLPHHAQTFCLLDKPDRDVHYCLFPILSSFVFDSPIGTSHCSFPL